MRDQSVLILGASGLIGSAVALRVAESNEVHGLSRFRDAQAAEALSKQGVKLIQMDAAQDDFGSLPDDFDYVFHEILMAPGECANFPQLAFETHAYTVANAFRRFRKAKGIVVGSTGSVYKPSETPVTEESTLSSYGGVENYALSKICADQFADYFSKLYGTPAAVLRYYYPYGAERGSLISSLVKRIGEGQPVGSSASLINPMFISDVAEMTIKAAEVCSVPANVINVGGAEIVNRRGLAEIVGEVIGKEPVFEEPDESASDSWVCDSGKRIRLLGVERVSLREGVRRAAKTAS